MNTGNTMDEYDTAAELLKARVRLKKVSQISYELKEIDNIFRQDYYLEDNAKKMLALYSVVEQKIVEVADDITNNR